MALGLGVVAAGSSNCEGKPDTSRLRSDVKDDALKGGYDYAARERRYH